MTGNPDLRYFLQADFLNQTNQRAKMHSGECSFFGYYPIHLSPRLGTEVPPTSHCLDA